jgi:hypothetical protein
MKGHRRARAKRPGIELRGKALAVVKNVVWERGRLESAVLPIMTLPSKLAFASLSFC